MLCVALFVCCLMFCCDLVSRAKGEVITTLTVVYIIVGCWSQHSISDFEKL